MRLWDRAYLLLELGDTGADRAFARLRALAKARGRPRWASPSSPRSSTYGGASSEVMADAKQVDVEKDSDLQDLYVIALALDAGGDAPTARSGA